jgi:uncharacterized protein YqgC (DUF456 family)
MERNAMLNVHFLIFVATYLLLIGGLVLNVAMPRVPGLAVVLAGLLLGGGYGLYEAGPTPLIYLPLLIIILLAAIGLSVSWWTEKLRIRLAYFPTQVMWGAMIGSFVGLFILGAYPVLGMILGLIVGTMIMELRSGRSFKESLRQGIASLIAMLGPKGFQLMMTLLLIGLGLRFLPLY